MAQQDFPYYWPLGFATAGEKIPGAAILQRRDGKDEPITLAGNMVWTGSMWVPVSTQNRLPVDAAVSGTVDVSDRADRQLGKVALTGQTVEIDGDTFEIDPPRTIYGKYDDKPDPDKAHAVIPYAYYVSVDKRIIEQTDGTDWVVV